MPRCWAGRPHGPASSGKGWYPGASLLFAVLRQEPGGAASRASRRGLLAFRCWLSSPWPQPVEEWTGPTIDPMPSQPSTLFVVSGCGRSGCAYTASVLTALGAPCGRGSVFQPAVGGVSARFAWPAGWAGDATWAAAPALGQLPEGATVLHQVRNPIEVIRSLLRIDFFQQPSVELDYARTALPELELGGPTVRAMRFWVEWNRMLETSADYDDLRYRRHRLEDLDARGVAGLCEFLGLARDEATIARVLDALPRNENTRGDRRRDAAVTWESLPKGALLDELSEMAETFGYAPGVMPQLRAS